MPGGTGSQYQKPMIPSATPARAWQTVGTDLFEIKGKQFIIISDYYSKYPIVKEMLITSKAVATLIEETCAMFGRRRRDQVRQWPTIRWAGIQGILPSMGNRACHILATLCPVEWVYQAANTMDQMRDQEMHQGQRKHSGSTTEYPSDTL